ncbi:MAG: hypothetical protein A2167_01735 [Planctomycetes bacterium RBG_13_46_10]|nr:MAG: hypothetical protein A2167_01735 [Planctomycetes bacterium RBG_13_46_10]QBM02868.1 hypothetical protein [uncultured archaeon]
MRIKAYNLIVLFFILFMALFVTKAQADPTTSREYQVKAAFLYNFIMFVDWPVEKMADINDPIIVGIIGNDPFGDAFEPVKDKKVKDKNVVLRRFKGLEELKKSAEKDSAQLNAQIKALKECHVLFICSSEKIHLKEIISLVENNGVLTVADTDGFIEAGGIINFVMEDKKVQFEINIVASEKARLKISSKLLRLAKRVIRVETNEKNQKHSKVDGIWNKTALRSEYVCHQRHDNKT